MTTVSYDPSRFTANLMTLNLIGTGRYSMGSSKPLSRMG